MNIPPHLSPLDKLSQEQRLQLLVTAVSDYAIYLLSPEGYVSSWNTGAQRFKGYTAQEIMGRHFSTFYTEEDRAAGIPEFALRAAVQEGKFEAEGWRVRKDGSRFWASIVIDPIRDQASGELVGFAKITRDVTERKRMQDALLASEEQFRLLVQGVTDYALYMLSPTGHISNWNAGAERIKGYSRDEVVNTHFSRFYTEEDRAIGKPAAGLETARREGRYEHEGWRVRKDGGRFWAHVIIDAIRDEHGELIGFAKITRDITEKKQTAEELEKANAALFQAQKMEAIGQLTGGIAHDFNNLLAVMSGALDMLAMRLTDGTDVKLLDTIQRAVRRGATMTQQLLAFARQQPLKVEVQNPNSIIGTFEAVLRRAGTPRIDFDFRLQDDVHPISVDIARFEAALLNLTVNARDAMPEGGAIRISTENVDLGNLQVGRLAEGHYVRISVSDTGSGMPPEVMAKACDPFFTTKEPGKGTGLGLSQVYGFINQSGGEVVLESEIGKGTTVSIYLPAEPASALQADKGKETVLIVEDEPDLMEVATLLFHNIGFDVLTASNGVDAINVLNRHGQVDLLFTDVVMPNGMSGIELAQYTRRHFPDIRIVLVSGFPEPALKSEYSDLGNFAFVSKPYRLADLIRKVRDKSLE